MATRQLNNVGALYSKNLLASVYGHCCRGLTFAPRPLQPKDVVEKRWSEFFSDPTLWWDNRTGKSHENYPDFKHKTTQEGLWLDSKFKPPWVTKKLRKVAPWTLQTNIFSYNTRLANFAKSGEYMNSIELFKEMEREGMAPNAHTFVPVLNACASLQALEEGRRIHALIMNSGCESDVFVGSCLVDMYAKCGSTEEAWNVFQKMPIRNAVSWSVMILGFAKCGEGQKALELFRQMEHEKVEPDPMAFVGILRACTSAGALEEGRRVHEQIIQRRRESNVYISNCLVDMYAKCGSIEDAWKVFSKMKRRNLVTWSAIILGYVKCGDGQKALELSQQMQKEGLKPDQVTFVGMLKACSSLAALEEGRRIHKQITKRRYESDLYVGSCLVDMYAKCGSIEDAQRVFQKMPTRNVVSWNTMGAGYALHGHTMEALQHFNQMCSEGVEMDGITFKSLLSACSHGGLVDEGFHYFELMKTVYGIPVTDGHHSCIIDLLGRAGRLHEVYDLINMMPFQPNVVVWTALLGACRIHGNVDLGECVAERVLELDAKNATGYLLLSNIYAGAGKWDKSASVERQRLHNGVKKTSGHTWIEVDNEVHSFAVEDRKHPQLAEIHAEIERLSVELHDAGYRADTRFALHDIDDEEKQIHLYRHGEKLAIAFGLISTPPGTPLRIFQNLRVCGDCHTAIKFISKIAERTILLRDASRFHHFEDGSCSCKDYW